MYVVYLIYSLIDLLSVLVLIQIRDDGQSLLFPPLLHVFVFQVSYYFVTQMVKFFFSIYFFFLYSNIIFEGHLLFACSNMVPSLGPKRTISTVAVPSSPSKQRRGGTSSAIKRRKFPSTPDNAATKTTSPSSQDPSVRHSTSLYQIGAVPELSFVSQTDALSDIRSTTASSSSSMRPVVETNTGL